MTVCRQQAAAAPAAAAEKPAGRCFRSTLQRTSGVRSHGSSATCRPPHLQQQRYPQHRMCGRRQMQRLTWCGPQARRRSQQLGPPPQWLLHHSLAARVKQRRRLTTQRVNGDASAHLSTQQTSVQYLLLSLTDDCRSLRTVSMHGCVCHLQAVRQNHGAGLPCRAQRLALC